MPDEYVRNGRLMASPMSVKSTISSIFAVDLGVRHAEGEAAEADVAVATGSGDQRGTDAEQLGLLGDEDLTTRRGSRPARAPSNVDLPDPLGPTTPMVSPSAASKDTPLRACT